MADHDARPGNTDAGNKKADSTGWADHPVFVRGFLWTLYISCALAAGAGFIWQKKKPHFELEAFPVFFAIYGFVMFALIVLVGQHLRKLVGRSEDYYRERE